MSGSELGNHTEYGSAQSKLYWDHTQARFIGLVDSGPGKSHLGLVGSGSFIWRSKQETVVPGRQRHLVFKVLWSASHFGKSLLILASPYVTAGPDRGFLVSQYSAPLHQPSPSAIFSFLPSVTHPTGLSSSTGSIPDFSFLQTGTLGGDGSPG